MELKGRAVMIDCRVCGRSSDLSDTSCFMAVARGLPPGFSGEVVLKGPIDRSYSGPVVDALVSCSEVLDRLEGLDEQARRADRARVLRGKRERAVKDAISSFRSDPRSLLGMKDELREGLKGKGGPDDLKLLEGLEDVLERTELMVRRLEASMDS